jgi:hypothetical protein
MSVNAVQQVLIYILATRVEGQVVDRIDKGTGNTKMGKITARLTCLVLDHIPEPAMHKVGDPKAVLRTGSGLAILLCIFLGRKPSYKEAWISPSIFTNPPR